LLDKFDIRLVFDRAIANSTRTIKLAAEILAIGKLELIEI